METTTSKASGADLSGLRIDRDATGDARGGGAAKRIAIIAVAAVVLLAGVALVSQRSGSFAPEVTVGAARMRAGGGPSAILTANGYVVAQRKAAVASKATGRLAELFVEEGSVVKTGEVLGRLEHADYDADVAKARADYEAGLARLVTSRRDSTFKQSEFNRQADLLPAGLTDQATHDRAKNEFDLVSLGIRESEAAVRSLKGALDFALANQEYTNIRAPFDATVLRKNAEIGEIVAPVSVGAMSARGAIVEIADMASLEVEVDVNEAYIARIQIGQRAEIRLDAYTGRPYGGHVRQIVPTANRQKATVVVKVAFDTLDRFVLPEMGAKVTFQESKTAEENAPPPMQVFVPKEAITERDGRGAVLVVEDGRVRTAVVETGIAENNEVEIRSGLRGGEAIILSPDAKLADGARVRAAKGAK
ncbi:MAG: efflux RND transporter periplasmic adaptor subunit [bacterium]